MRDKIIYITLLVTILFGAFFRFYKLVDNPPSLSIDEVSMGYSAYSVLKTGRDETGIFLPVAFPSTGDYKNPVTTYLIIPSIALFGLNEFGVRFPTALIGTLSILIVFLLVFTIFQNKVLSLFCAILLSVSPWHIFYSRIASESLIGTFLLMMATWLFFVFLKKSYLSFLVLSAIFFVATFYTYHSFRLFTPLFILVLVISNRKKILLDKKSFYIFGTIILAGLFTVGYLSIFNNISNRLKMVLITNDIDYTRYAILDHIHRFDEIFILFFFWAKRFLNYFQPEFLFFTGLNMTAANTLGLGVLQLFEIPWLLLGSWMILVKKIPHKWIIIVWILVGIFPASLTNNEQSEGRTLLILPPLLIISSFGAIKFFTLIQSITKHNLKMLVSMFYLAVIVLTLANQYLIFTVHFPLQKGEAFMEGTKESVIFAIENKDQYSEIIYDPYRGVEAPYIVNIPHAYILFYSQYDPVKFQQEVKDFSTKGAHFDKFTIRRINWRESLDRNEKGKMFIGSPWSLPVKDLKDAKILKEIYLKNGNLALLIVSTN